MKTSLLLMMLSLSSVHASSLNCFKSVEDQYLQMNRGVGFDYFPKLGESPVELVEGEAINMNRGITIGPFSEDVFIYRLTGSIHSGWFSNALVVNTLTCEILKVIQTASE